MRQVILLALPPRQLVFGILDEAVAAPEHDLAHGVAEARADFGQRRFAAAVLGGVVQQRADRFVFVGAVFHRDGRHAEHVRDVGNAGALPPLPLVDLIGVQPSPTRIGRSSVRHQTMVTSDRAVADPERRARRSGLADDGLHVLLVEQEFGEDVVGLAMHVVVRRANAGERLGGASDRRSGPRRSRKTA